MFKVSHHYKKVTFVILDTHHTRPTKKSAIWGHSVLRSCFVSAGQSPPCRGAPKWTGVASRRPWPKYATGLPSNGRPTAAASRWPAAGGSPAALISSGSVSGRLFEERGQEHVDFGR